MTNLEDFRTITIILPEWAYKMVHEIAAFECVSVNHLMSFSVKVALFDFFNESNEKSQFLNFTDAWFDIKERLSGEFKCLKRCLSGEKIARPGSSIDLTLDTPHEVSISLRNFWIHLIEEQVGTDPEKVVQRIAEIVTKSIQEMAYAEQVHYPS